MIPIEDTISAPLASIPTDEKLAYRVFVRVGGKLIQFRSIGDTVTQQRLDDLRQKKVQVLHIPRQEYLSYLNALEERLQNDGIEEGSEESALQVRELLMAYFRQVEERRELEGDFLQRIVEISNKLPIAIGSKKEIAFKLLKRNADASQYFSNHAVNTAVYSVTIGLKLSYDLKKLQNLAMAGLVANIGIIQVPKEILYKPEALTTEEFAQIREHPIRGAKLLKTLGAPDVVTEAVLHHHERFDGGGYPHGLTQEGISVPARVVSIAEVFSAMTSLKPWGKPIPAGEAIQEMITSKGKFDPQILAAK